MRAGCDATRSAWDSGHAAVAKAFAELRAATENVDAELARTAWTTIVNRILGPGAHTDLPSTVRRLLSDWNSAETRLSLEIPNRVFGALSADDDSLDKIFRLGDNVSRYRRSRVIGSYFWPRGNAAARIQLDGGNAFGLLPTIDQAMLRESLGAGAQVIDVIEWSHATERLIHRILIEDGYVILRFAPGGRGLARIVALQMQLEPVDVGALFAYPRMIGVWHRDGHVNLELVLDEALG